MDEEELEEEYNEKISKEFVEIIDAFKMKTKMDRTSMIRLLSEQIVNYTNEIDVLGKG